MPGTVPKAININEECCTGCRECTIYCSAGEDTVLKLDESTQKMKVVDLDICWGCLGCEANCEPQCVEVISN